MTEIIPAQKFQGFFAKWIMRGLLVGLSLLVLEAVGVVALALDPAADDGPVSPALVPGRPGAELPNQPFLLRHEALHPFLGFVQDPAVLEIATARGRVVPRVVTEQGFVDLTAEAGAGPTVEVVVLGGSVALQLVSKAGDVLATELSRLPQFQGRRVRVRSLAVGGYKQPQQLLVLIWELSLGRKIDLLINLDGYNDIVLGYTENLTEGVFPFYPRGWRWRTQDLPDPDAQAAVGKLVFLRTRRQGLADGFQKSLLAKSAMASYLWLRADLLLAAQVTTAERELRNSTTTPRKKFAVTGPPFAGGADDYAREAVAVWGRCSLQMATLTRGLGIEYHHFLQPNQHDPGAKQLTGREAIIAADAEPAAVDLIRRGYPLLSLAGEQLRSQGVRFHDLRKLFATVQEPLYVDSCCHLGEQGNGMLARAIVARIGDGAVD